MVAIERLVPAAALEFCWLNFDLLSSCAAAFAFSAELTLADQISSWGDPRAQTHRAAEPVNDASSQTVPFAAHQRSSGLFPAKMKLALSSWTWAVRASEVDAFAMILLPNGGGAKGGLTSEPNQ